jgi:hypothetical protein
LRDTQAEELLAPPVLIQDAVGTLSQLLHVRPDEHLAKLDKIAMVLVVDFNDTPWILPSAHSLTIGGDDFLVGADDGEWDLTLSGG